MAIYHFTVAVISRARGQRIVALAAAHAAARLRDEYYGAVHDRRRRDGVQFTEIAAPPGAPSWVLDREQLWNRVEAAERRKDSQLARAVEISLPVELDLAQCRDLVRDFVHAEFVAKRMVADMSIRRTKLGNPNAHLLLTLREAGASGFGPKMRQWNRKDNLLAWRSSWATFANLHLARAGHAVRIDHRSLADQQIDLTPTRRIGIGRPSADLDSLPEHLQTRFVELKRIANDNGCAILEDPAIAIRALARQRRFTRADLEQYLSSRTNGAAQLNAVRAAVMASPDLAALDAAGDTLYTSRDLQEAEKSLARRAHNMTKRGDFHAVAVPQGELNKFLDSAHDFWTGRGKQIREAMPAPGEALGSEDVVLLEGAEMIDLKTLEKILDVAERARAALMLIADADRLQTMGALSPLHALMAGTAGTRPVINAGKPLVP